MSLRKQVPSLLLIVAAAGLGVYVYMDRGNVTEGERALREQNVLPAYRGGDVSRVELVHGDETTVLERDAEGWRMTSPRNERADAAAVDSFLRDLELASKLRTVPGPVAGFDRPRATGAITMGSVVYRFALGGPAPTPEGASYLRVDDVPYARGGTFVISKGLATQLSKTADAYRERGMVPYPVGDIAKLEVRGKNGAFELERTSAIDLTLGGTGLRASRAALEHVWSALAELRAEAFPSDADAERATRVPVLTVALTPTDPSKPRAEFVFGDVCPGNPEDVVVVRTAPTKLAACAPRVALEGLSVPADTLVDPRLFGAHDDEVAELSLRAVPQGAALEIARKANGWHERAPDERDLSPEEGEAAEVLARALTRAEGTDVRHAEGAPFAPRSRATIVRAEGLGTEVVELGAPEPDGSVKVRRLADGALLRVTPEVARKLEPRGTAIRGHAVWNPPLDPDHPRHLVLRCDGTVQDLVYGDHSWTMKPPFPVDTSGAFDVVNAVSRARAEAWVADRDDGTFGLGPAAPPCSVSLTTESDGGERTATLTFGSQGEGGVYTRAEGPGSSGSVLVAPLALRDAVSRLLVDRSVFRVDPDTLESVTVREGKRQVTYTRAGDTFAAPDGGPGSTVIEALAALTAERVVHLGPPRPDEGLDRPVLEIQTVTIGDAGPKRRRFVFGLTTESGHEKMVYTRAEGIDATYLVPKARLAPLLDEH